MGERSGYVSLLNGRASKVALKVCLNVGVFCNVNSLDLVPVDEAADPRGDGKVSNAEIVTNNPIVAFELLVQNAKKTISFLSVTLNGVRDLREYG